MEDSTLELIKYDNQIKNPNSQSVPDGRIKGLFDFFIENKIKEKSINIQQIEKHFPQILGYVNSLNIIDDDLELIKIFPVTTNEKSIKNRLKKLKNKICEEPSRAKNWVI